MKQKPIIAHSKITGKWYLVTKYIDYGNGRIEAVEKREATENEMQK